jgi:methionyl-tRNA formyltransferase
MNKFNFAFFGTPKIASDTLEILKSNGYMPSIIITSIDKPSGRGLHLTPSPVSLWAENNNIPCLKPEKINQNFIEEFAKLNIDLSIVVAYGKILPETLIQNPKLGTINIHYSLLPKYRGASPLESALLNGDTETGVSIQQMAYKLDSGDIIASKETDISINDTKENIKNKLIKLGGDLLCEIIPDIINKKINLLPQREEDATFCKKINKEDGELDLNANGIENYNKYRAFYGWPGTYFFATKHDRKIRVKIKEASFENNTFTIKRVTPEGKKEINYEDFLRQN